MQNALSKALTLVKSREAQKRFSRTPLGIYSVLVVRSRRMGYKICSQGKFLDWYNVIPKKCVYCDIPEDKLVPVNRGQGRKIERLTIDRIDNDQGYTMGNIALACIICNVIKSDKFTFDEMTIIGKSINNIWKRKRLVL